MLFVLYIQWLIFSNVLSLGIKIGIFVDDFCVIKDQGEKYFVKECYLIIDKGIEVILSKFYLQLMGEDYFVLLLIL